MAKCKAIKTTPTAHPPTQSTIAALEGLRNEVVAGGVLLPISPEARAWNDCIQRTLNIIDKYKKGEGLFQIL